MLIDIAALIAALAFVVLVGYAVFTLIQVRKTMIELRMILLNANSQLPSLLNDLRIMIQKINALTDEARDGIAHGSGFLQAIETVGQTVERVQGLVSGQGLVSKLSGMVGGIKAVSAVVRERLSQPKSRMNGDGSQ